MLMNEARNVQSREDLAAFVERLCAHLEMHPEQWENVTLDRYLEALSAYLKDLDGLSRNVTLDIDVDQAQWRLFALALAGASIYE